jgi:hypothetical protein
MRRLNSKAANLQGIELPETATRSESAQPSKEVANDSWRCPAQTTYGKCDTTMPRFYSVPTNVPADPVM